MFADRIEHKWIEAFAEVLAKCAVREGEVVAILSETQSRALNVHLAELALLRLGARPFHLVLPTARNPHPVPIRSTGASEAIEELAPVVGALSASSLVVDLTVQQTYHELAKIAKDCAAAAVMIFALVAVAIALLLLLPPFVTLVQDYWVHSAALL